MKEQKEKQIILKGNAGELRDFFKFVLKDETIKDEINEMPIADAIDRAKTRYKKLKGGVVKDESKIILE